MAPNAFLTAGLGYRFAIHSKRTRHALSFHIKDRSVNLAREVHGKGEGARACWRGQFWLRPLS